MIKLPLFYVLSIACFTSMSVALPDVKKKGGFRKPRSLKVKTKHARTELQKVLRVPNNPRDQSPSAPVSVQAILVPRSISIRFFIQLSCILSLLFSLMNCLQTAGIPHIRAIWELISEDGSVMPKHYRPTSFDIHFARIIAANTNEIVPPIGIPSARPLFGFCASIVVYVGSTILLPCWFTPIRVFLDYKKLQAVSPNLLKENTAASVLVHINDKNIQQDLAGTSEDNRRMAHSSFLCKLKPSYEVTGKPKKEARDINRALGYSHPSPFYFEVNQCRFYFDPTNRTCLGGGPLLQAASLRDLEHLSRDGLSKSQRMVAEERYRPYNQPKLATPTIHEAFLTRISSPLVIVQLLGRLLSVLEDGSRALTNTMFTLAHHYINSRQAIISARQMAKEVQTSVQDTSSMKVMVLKNRKKKKWVPTTASKLIPGDIFTMSVNNNGDDFLVIPIDSLLLDGQGLVNEAVLTGESVPQSKMPIDFEEEIRKRDAILDLHDHRCSILFAGTTMVHCSSDGANEKSRGQSSLLPSRNEPRVTCLALRTGTYSSKGQLLQALKSSTHVGAISNAQSEKDAMRLIASLSVFAVASCISLFIPPRGHNRGATVSVFRRIIQCTRIAIASIPSDLPLALSSVARSCSKKLRRESDVICSEPGSLLTAAYVDTVVFDKVRRLFCLCQSFK